MEALEFSTRIEDGIIKLPIEFEEYGNEFVRIIILSEKPLGIANKKEKLKDVMKKMQTANIFKSIKDPMEWQKKLRDEWE